MTYSSKNLFLVTGASSGIGMGVALRLNQLGAKVIVTSKDIQKLNILKSNSKYPENIHIESKDLLVDDNLDKWVIDLSKKYGKIQGIILCAGIQQTLPMQTPNFIKKTRDLFDINFFANIDIVKGFSDRRVNIGSGSSVVFISSIASIRGNSGLSGYSASKGAMNSAVKSLAVELSRYKIRVNAILPGFVKTNMINDWQGSNSSDFIEEIDNRYPLGIGEVEDIVEPVLFLLSNKAKWITGTELVVDGGGSL